MEPPQNTIQQSTHSQLRETSSLNKPLGVEHEIKSEKFGAKSPTSIDKVPQAETKISYMTPPAQSTRFQEVDQEDLIEPQVEISDAEEDKLKVLTEEEPEINPRRRTFDLKQTDEDEEEYEKTINEKKQSSPTNLLSL